MKYQNKLVRNGNATQVALPKKLLDWLQWNCGQSVIVQANLDRTVTVRRPRPDDLDVDIVPHGHVGDGSRR
jgi:antitoxin component of MazEF toxin-antitoxin module